jgi:hypothetical protein
MQQLREIIAETIHTSSSGLTPAQAAKIAAGIVTPALWGEMVDTIRAELKDELKMELYVELDQMRSDILGGKSKQPTGGAGFSTVARNPLFGATTGDDSNIVNKLKSTAAAQDAIPASLANNPLFVSVNKKLDAAKAHRATPWTTEQGHTGGYNDIAETPESNKQWDKLLSLQEEQLATYTQQTYDI